MDIIKLIYERAKEKGIEIEKNPKHRKDKDIVGAGVRFIKFANSLKIYKYRGTLREIGLRLELISQQEFEQSYLEQGYIRCPRCKGITSNDIVKEFGYCLNC